MRVVIQRAGYAYVTIDGNMKSRIGKGLMILVGFENEDTENDLEWMTKKVLNLRIFGDEIVVMNRSVIDINGEILLISQFTLHALTSKGNRPSDLKSVV